jgi:Tfp pilus assembly protein PilV
MLKVWSIIRGVPGRARHLGFSTIEVILAATVFGVLVTALTGAVVYGRASSADAGETNRAHYLAEEGVEAIRNIRDVSYASLPASGDWGLQKSAGVWTLTGTSDSSGIFSRKATFTTVDTTHKNVVVTVSWSTGSATNQVTATARFVNWRAALVTGPIMMAYSKTTTTPFYRTWNGTTWSAEGSASAGTGNINYIVLKSSRTRNEAVLGTQTSTGAIYFQVWNGTSWGAATQVGTGTTTTRSFDIAYERNSDHAVIAYLPTAASTDFAYRTWDGTTLSGATTVTTPTTGVTNWIELRQNPLITSDDIAMITLDATSDVYCMLWNGTAWGNMGVATAWDTTGSSATRKGIDVEYEQTTGNAMFMWADSVATDQFYRIWNGTTLSATNQLLDIPAQSGVGDWVQLTARPNSNEIMYGVQSTTGDLNTRKWSGSAWDTATQHAEHATASENPNSRNFDLVWETHASNPGDAWLLWGNGTTVSKKQWSGTWGGATTLTGSDDTTFLRLRADPISGAVFAGIYEDTTSGTDDIWESRLTGGGTTWTAKNTIWAGPTTASPATFKIDIATP